MYESTKQANQRYYNRHKEKILTKSRETMRLHRLDLLAKGLCTRCAKNPLEAGKTSCRTCLDKRVKYQLKRQALEYGGSVGQIPVTAESWADLCEKFGNKCLGCDTENIPLQIDHVVPLIRGGAHGMENLQPLCSTCNRKKSTKIIDFRTYGSSILQWT